MRRQSMWHLSLSLISLALFAGCAMGPDYKRPPIPMPETFRIATGPGPESLANLPWWDLLRDKQLQQLIRTAISENKDLKRALATIDEYQARLMIARTDFAPQINGSANAPVFGRQTTFTFPGFPNPFAYYLQANLSWEMDIWGRIRRATEAGLSDLLAREENRRAVILDLVSSVAQAYFDLLQFDMQLDIARRTLKSWEESVRIAQARLRQGVISKLDADQFEAERANAAARAAELERQVVQKENELSVLLGQNPQPIKRGLSLTEQVMPPDVPPGLPSELLQRRPDIIQAEQELHAATARIGAAKADRFPKISLTSIFGIANPVLTNLVKGGGRAGGQFFEAGGGLTAPLINAQAFGFQQEAVEAQARQALAQYEQRVLVAFREVEDSLVAVKTAREQREAQAQQVAALRSALNLANLRYKGGVANYLDVLIAQRNLFEAELALTSSHRLHLVSIVQLYRALGGGWPPNGTADGSQAPS